ncbi:MAG: ABC transporter permease [Candidatus Tectomicrobia bacterium]|uniref:ABC transporter permease n=1 Tax=Tectimicrobiota bacterium TaxID=2528274 RepID=A0A938B116_UNCTE|nr:ABC transporter permease [Candidatus Tectomicrobia bacterium]
MIAVIVRRLLRLVVVCLGISLITFLLLHLSGDPVAMILPEATEADRAVLRETLGLNRPFLAQYGAFLGRALQGDFGQSFFHRTPALPLVFERMPTTILLTVFAMVLAIGLAIPAGILTAVKRYSIIDHLVTLLVLLGQSMPVFWTGIMLMLLFAVAWNLLPASGWDTWASTVLPAITLGTFQAPLFLRISRSAMLEVLGLDYVRTARAKGLHEWVVIIKHALKNAAIPIVTVIGLQFGVLLGGAVVTETVFAIPGTGRLIIRAIGQLDFPVVQAGVMTLSLIIVLTNFLVDLLYLWLNPQVRIS